MNENDFEEYLIALKKNNQVCPKELVWLKFSTNFKFPDGLGSPVLSGYMFMTDRDRMDRFHEQLRYLFINNELAKAKHLLDQLEYQDWNRSSGLDYDPWAQEADVQQRCNKSIQNLCSDLKKFEPDICKNYKILSKHLWVYSCIYCKNISVQIKHLESFLWEYNECMNSEYLQDFRECMSEEDREIYASKDQQCHIDLIKLKIIHQMCCLDDYKKHDQDIESCSIDYDSMEFILYGAFNEDNP